jgi:hypothetical protein
MSETVIPQSQPVVIGNAGAGNIELKRSIFRPTPIPVRTAATPRINQNLIQLGYDPTKLNRSLHGSGTERAHRQSKHHQSLKPAGVDRLSPANPGKVLRDTRQWHDITSHVELFQLMAK